MKEQQQIDKPDRELSRTGRLAEEAENFLADHRFAPIAIFTLVYLPYVCARALLKPLWFDELATLLVARLDSFAAIMAALNAGVDAHPPLSFLMIHWSMSHGGNELITARVPSMFGFWLMSICLYVFASRRGFRVAALLAMFMPLLSGLLYYATEARPYGLILGFSALALVLWQNIPETRYGVLTRTALFLALAADLFTHYYAVLIPIALGLGEVARTTRTKKFDWWSFSAIGAPYVSLLILRPMLVAQTGRLGVHWAHPTLQAVFEFYEISLGPILLPLLFIVFAVAIYERRRHATASAIPDLPYEELIAALAFLLIPVLSYLLAVFVTHTYTGRYSVAGLIGMSILFWWLAGRFFRRGLQSALLAGLILIALIGLDELRMIRRVVRPRSEAPTHDLFPFTFDGTLPIVIHDARDFLPMFHYASRDLKPRLYYLSDAKESVKYSGTVGLDQTLIDFKKLAALPVDNFDSFVRAHHRFLLFWGKPEGGALVGWQMSKLKDAGARFELLEHNDLRLLFEVEIKTP